MANVRDSDTSLWLHNKLGTSNDSWTGGSICNQLNAEVLRNIKDCFPDLQTQWKVELEEILEVAQVDSEQWVSMLAEIMKTLPSTGSLNTNITESENRRIFSDLFNDLRKLVKKQSDLGMLPLECHYLNKMALNSVVGQQSAPPKHFTLKRKPKSAALRAELLQKSVDAQSNMKKSTAPTVPVRSRGMPRKMTDTTPLKGLPSRALTGSFRSPVSNSLSRPSLPRTPAGRKDGGIKLLDINEQPLGFAQAKKRKRMQELEEAKRASESMSGSTGGTGSVSGTPDYAVGLTALNPPTPTPASATATPSYIPTANTTASVVTISGASTSGSTTVLQSHQANQQQLVSDSTSVSTLTTQPATALQSVIHVRPAQQVVNIATAQPTTAAATPAPSAPRKGAQLSLTREQMLEAQEMFRTANKVTRPEKALILGFMAGSRENPCPQLGNIVTIKLSENQENVQQADNTFLIMLVETHFQMNYNTGEWKRIHKFREIDDSTHATHVQTVCVPVPPTAAAATAAQPQTVVSAVATTTTTTTS
ncbi:negative elongation factor A isoform X2 [Lycorma delicatula]|uniref:negative elongation factor A isoform X2 n=1 Tax=Lycorma delicatula TaxID=130591 RepID=UPI003F513B3D